MSIYKCFDCKKQFRSSQGLGAHRKWCGYVPPEQETYACQRCGTLSYVGSSKTNQFCSLKCANAFRAESILKDDAYWKRKRAIQNEAWARYEARKRDQTPDDADLTLIQEIYAKCPDGYEVDHIIPISKGGLHHQDNLQYLTVKENRSKGNRI